MISHHVLIKNVLQENTGKAYIAVRFSKTAGYHSHFCSCPLYLRCLLCSYKIQSIRVNTV